MGDEVRLDDLDWAILEVLRDDGRLPVAALADRVQLSRAACYARLERLRASGVLEGFSARINPAHSGQLMTAVLLLRIDQHRWSELAEVLVELEAVEYCALTTGEFDVLVLCRTPDMTTLRDVVLGRLAAMDAVRSTVTVFALQELLHRPYVVADRRPR